MPFLEYKNKKFYYEVHGQGEPLLYLHGWNGNIAGFKKNLVPYLNQNFQCIAFDLPGFGQSQPYDLSFDDLTQSVQALLDHLKIQSVHLIGFCMGGTIALDYAIRFQDRVKKIILVETYADFPWFLSLLIPGWIGHRLFRFFLTNPLGIRCTKHYLLLRDQIYRDDFFEAFQKADPNVSLYYIRMLWDYAKRDHYQRMRELTRETLLVMGKDTKKHIKESIQKLNQHIRGSMIEALDRAGHFPIEENSRDLIEKIRDFVKQ